MASGKDCKTADTYLVVYDFGDVAHDVAVAEFEDLLSTIESVGLHTEVRPCYDGKLLIFVKAPAEVLSNAVYKSRVKDWLYGITPTRPSGAANTVVEPSSEAEALLALYHLLQFPNGSGGAGITPGIGKWRNVSAMYPLHNASVNQSLLRRLSSRLLLSPDDLDCIRDLLGSKVAFYFAFIQTYLVFLSFPAATGICAWLWFSDYSLAYAILTSIWCTVFLEYWKAQETDLGIRWGVRGVYQVKANRPQFRYTKIVKEGSGHVVFSFPRWKQIARQMLQIPFLLLATLILGTMIAGVFAIEILISEIYTGPYKLYLEYLPTVLLAVAIPFIGSSLEAIARHMTEYENHRTEDFHEMALTQKMFALSIITNYLPIFLTAFVYVPFGQDIVPKLQKVLGASFPGLDDTLAFKSFRTDSDRLRNEVIALTVTGQIFSFFEENILPLVKHRALRLYERLRRSYFHDALVIPDDPEEAAFLDECRNQLSLAKYNVQDDIAELVLQFGYLALFSPAWPLIPLGFFINNWVELRSDFAKICMEHQRPAPIRADSIGSWIDALDTLTWVGSISTAAIVHLFGSHSIGGGSWTTLPITIFIGEHVLLLLRTFTRWIFERYGSEQVRKERKERYAARRQALQALEAQETDNLGLSVQEKERRRSSHIGRNDRFWMKQIDHGSSAATGIKWMKEMKEYKQRKGMHLKEE